MPTYDYQCRSCGHTIEVIHSMTEEGPKTCERCGGELRRVLYPTGIIFKGSGFYKTDSRASGSGSSSTAAKPAKEKATTTTATETSAPSGSGDSSASATSAAPAKESAAG